MKTKKSTTNAYRDLYKTIEDFFAKYLIAERGASSNTIRSYRDTIVLLETFFDQQLGIRPSKLSLENFTKDNIMKFLKWLENKGNSASTRNNRCAAIKSLARYLTYVDPIHMNQWHNLSAIAPKKDVRESVKYITVEAMTKLFESIDLSTATGRRDHTILTLLYYTGMRAQELVDLTPSCIRKSQPYIIEVLGKGSKKRIVPIDDDLFRLLASYMREAKIDTPEKNMHPLFFNAWGENLTTAGLTYIIRKHATPTRSVNPDLFTINITPHVFRHSRAMHLLESGVELIYIRDLLGHVSVQTTEIYARADARKKREAITKAYSSIGRTEPEQTSWEKDSKLKAFLKSLC